MSDMAWWFAVGIGLLVAELLTGTFYLLMIAIGCAVGGLVAMAGADLPLQLVCGAAVGFAATTVLRRTRWGRRRQLPDASRNPDVLLDIGEVVDVAAWHDGAAVVRYRGCRWEATLEPGAPARPGAQVIKAIRGSTLVLAPVAA